MGLLLREGREKAGEWDGKRKGDGEERREEGNGKGEGREEGGTRERRLSR